MVSISQKYFVFSLVFLIASIESTPVPDQNLECIDCNNSNQKSSAVLPIVTHEEIKEKIMEFEREKILGQLRRKKGTTILDNETISNDTVLGRVRNVRSIMMPNLRVESEIIENNPLWNDTNSDWSPKEMLQSKIILGKLPQRGSTTTEQCMDEIYKPTMGTCIEFISNTGIDLTRIKFIVLRYLLKPEVLAHYIGNGRNAHVHTFAVTRLNTAGTGSNQLTSNVTWRVVDGNQYISMDITQLILRPVSSSSPDPHDPDLRVIALRITCLTCGNSAKSKISIDSKRVSFLQLGLTARKGRGSATAKTTRQCELTTELLVKEPSDAECCMVPVQVNFKDLQLDWIIFPTGYLTAYCNGRCYQGTTRTYGAVVQSVVNKRLKNMGNNKRFAMCCFPTATDSVQIIYQNASGDVLTTQLTEMVVTSCGC